MRADAVLRLPATAEALRELYPWLEDTGLAAGIPPAVLSRMHVAAEEAVSNAVRHGIPPGAAAEIILTLRVADAAAELILEDPGIPFDPAAAPLPERSRDLAEITPGGWGLGLLRRFCPQISYSRVGDANRLTLRYPIGAGSNQES